ncbi:PLP-dependent aminotransferase family protein [Niastella caeni]|uniref:PLP-dependent aminotransferase family protein n=1 Tax=Niastella caeni TaxID=2569763 RepID=A0A4S8HXZ4_9BACT|nr:PLP-dependent aminotransferase family protein [Niastella caeni]THU40577.1 PLP-dependent aminotransferase family protein [Niastella caeni]
MQALSTLIIIDKNSVQPVYLQIANQLMVFIKDGNLQASHRLPSTRQMADWLQVHRKTVIQAYDELLAQGWLESRTGSGTYVAKHLPEIHPRSLLNGSAKPINPAHTAGFEFETLPHLATPPVWSKQKHHLDDGFPDSRLAPLEELARAYRSQLLTGNPYVRLGYGDTLGSLWLRQVLASYLNDTRGLKITSENILITRGTVMGLYLSCTAFLQPGDIAVVGELNYNGANMNFLQAGTRLLKIPVDEHGIVVEALADICRKQRVRMVYVTSHHFYPTTTALRADRRLELLKLAGQYGFIIFEDDYDYDFHYLSKPLLPLASADKAGMVLYCGSFTKSISPAFRVGYLVASENVIRHLAQLRRIIDRQGDILLENAIAELLQNGIIQRYLRKALRTYKQRRDVFCDLLKSNLSNYVQFQVPVGGMAVWTHFDPAIDLNILSQKALQHELYFASGYRNDDLSPVLNATRLGFASSTPAELESCVEIMVRLLKGG